MTLDTGTIAAAGAGQAIAAREKQRVGVGRMQIERRPALLSTVLGSCVGVMVYDSMNGVGGLAHVMLPSAGRDKSCEAAKFADTAVPELVDRVLEMGANRGRLVAKLAGGARMFNFKKSGSFNDIGDMNVAAAKECLRKVGVRLVGEHTGGGKGRTVDFDLSDGEVRVLLGQTVVATI